MRRVLKSLALSLLIDLGLVIAVIAIFDDWPAPCFFIILSWPLIWMVLIIKSIKDPQVDMIKMETYFNVGAIRRKTDRM